MDLSGCAVKLDHSVGTPDSIPNMRSDIFGMDVTDLFGLDFTRGYSIYECAQHEIIYIWFGFYTWDSIFYEYVQHEIRYIWFGFYTW
jgi:hypothetical protein